MVDEAALRRKVQELEDRVRRLEMQAAWAQDGDLEEAPSAPRARGKAATSKQAPPSPVPSPLPSPSPPMGGWIPVEAPPAPYPASYPSPSMAADVAGPTAALEPAPASPGSSNASRSAAVELLLGGNWLARIGVFVLALGVLFFLKLAYDSGWVPLWGRIAIGVVGGLALFATGDRLLRRGFDSKYSQVLAGGGAVIAYATVYAAYAMPHYRAALHVSLPVEVACLAAVSAGLGAYALWRNLPVLAGAAVGLTALLVAPAGDFSTVGLLFVGLMGSALLVATAWRGWSRVVLTSIIALNVAHLAAIVGGEVPWTVTLASVVLVDTLAVIAAARAKVADPLVPSAEAGLAVTFLALVAWRALDVGGFAHPGGWTLLAVGLASVAACLAARNVAPGLGGAGGLMLLAWPMAHFGPDATRVEAYLALGALAAGIALALPAGRRWVRMHGTAATALGALWLVGLAQFDGLARGQPLLAGGLAAALVALAGLLWFTGRRDPASAGTADGALAVGLALLAVWPFLQYPGSLGQTVLLVLAAAGLLAVSLWRSAGPWMRAAGVALAALAAVSLILLGVSHDVGDAQPLASAGVALAVLAVAATAWRLDRSPASLGAMATSTVALATAVTLTLAWPFLQFRGTLWQTATFGLLAWALVAVALVRRPEARTLRLWALALVAAGTLSLAVFATEGLVARHPAASVGAAVLLAGAAAALWWALRTESAGELGSWSARSALALAALVPVVELGHLVEGWAIAVSWAALALSFVVAGLALRSADVRVASLALFGVVVGRIFLVDLATLSMPARVLAFIGTGALLLLGAYLFARQRKGEAAAPPPPAGPAASVSPPRPRAP